MPTSHPRHSITETPDLSAALAPLRDRLGDRTPSLAELVKRGAAAELQALEVSERARQRGLDTFVDRLCASPLPDLSEVEGIRRTTRQR